MPANAYIGIDNLARKVNSIYVGIDGVAHKVKNGFIGIAGVARKFFSSGPSEASYYGTLTSLPVGGIRVKGANAGNKTLFVGGYYIQGSINVNYNTVVYYDSSLTQGSAPNLTFKENYIDEANFNNNAVFANDSYVWNNNNIMNVYSPSLTLSSHSPFSTKRGRISQGVIGNYLVFAAGVADAQQETTSNTVDYLNTSFTRQTASPISVLRHSMGYGGKTKDYLIFGSGVEGVYNVSGYVRASDAYDTSMTRLSCPAFTSGYLMFSATGSISDGCIFGSYSTGAFYYSNSLTITRLASNQGINLEKQTGTTLKDLALIGTGAYVETNPTEIGVYDVSLTRQSVNLKTGRSTIGIQSNGNYAIFAGGIIYNSDYAGAHTSVVEAIKAS